MNTRLNNKNIFFLASIILFISLATGCVVNPAYEFAQDEKYTSMKVVYQKYITMCRDGKMYSLQTTYGSDYVKVPLGKRISVGIAMSFTSSNYSYRCKPFMSFLPKEGINYIADANVAFGKCYISMVKESDASITGVALEESIGPRDCVVATAE